MAEVTLVVDGACRGNPGRGGFAAILQCKRADGSPHELVVSGGFAHTTNNRMEVMAVLKGLQALKGQGHTVTVISDSQYVVDGLNKWLAAWQAKGWRTAKKKAVENQDLWQQVAMLVAQHSVRAEKVAGHNGHPLNERADKLACAAADGITLAVDEGYMAAHAIEDVAA